MDVTIATVDIVIGTMLAYLLSRSRSGFRNTDSMINRLIVYTVASGLLTAVDALVALIVTILLPETLLYFVFAAIGPKRTFA